MSQIIHVITTIDNGGAEKQLLTLAREQSLLGNSIEVIPLKGNLELENNFIENNIKVNKHLINQNPIIQILKFRKYLDKNHLKNSVVHAHLPRAELFTRFAIHKQKFVITRHNSEKFIPNGSRLISSYVSRKVTDRSSTCIAISNAVKFFLIQNNEIRDSAKIMVIHYGYMPMPKKSRKTLISNDFTQKKKSNAMVIGTITRLEPQKDVTTLLKAMSLIAKEYGFFKLMIVGAGSMESGLRELCNDLNVSEVVIWLGRTSDVYRYLSQFDLFVLSTNYEGFGLVLLEAMQCRLPILASNNSSIPEVLGEDSFSLFKTGDFHQLANKILTMLDPKKRLSLARSNHARLKLFDPKLMSKKVMEIYSR